jgi:hypothetical protein
MFETTPTFMILINSQSGYPTGWFGKGSLYMARMRLLRPPAPRGVE